MKFALEKPREHIPGLLLGMAAVPLVYNLADSVIFQLSDPRSVQGYTMSLERMVFTGELEMNFQNRCSEAIIPYTGT